MQAIKEQTFPFQSRISLQNIYISPHTHNRYDTLLYLVSNDLSFYKKFYKWTQKNTRLKPSSTAPCGKHRGHLERDLGWLDPNSCSLWASSNQVTSSANTVFLSFCGLLTFADHQFRIKAHDLSSLIWDLLEKENKSGNEKQGPQEQKFCTEKGWVGASCDLTSSKMTKEANNSTAR